MGRKQDLVDTALRLFYEHGIHAIGINQVLQEAGVAKQTLYNHFESKDSLVEAAVEHRDNLIFSWLETRMNSRPAGEEALLEMFDAVHDWFNNREPALPRFCGCFFINACGEYSDPEHPVHKRCAVHKARVFELLKMHAEKVCCSQAEAEQLANALFLLKEGAIVKAHVEGDLDAALKAKAIASGMILPH
ncbi:TetR/AcrR family transcriptional regulator [Marinobacter mobilis]|uniref:Transcriptional regulator, TetR family n=1 Tax=Marinobacter mobilis TaxID=488533 RepID=A0A1H2VF04_9GAMM|nr:TetR/AcrR family transcriptional regulator [Marinobacter mobilis]SDW66935.1 transcriptional regulator, TetR family [Marinobacter mobilis]